MAVCGRVDHGSFRLISKLKCCIFPLFFDRIFWKAFQTNYFSPFWQNFPGRTSVRKWDLFWTGCWMPMSCHSLLRLHPSSHCCSMVGRTERLAVLPTKCGVVAVHAAAGREERRMASSVLRLDFSAWHCARQRGCHQVGVRRLSPLRPARLQSPSGSHTRRSTRLQPIEWGESWKVTRVFFELDFVEWHRWVRRSMEGRQRQGGGGITMLLLAVRFVISLQFEGRAYSTFLYWNGYVHGKMTGNFDVILLFLCSEKFKFVLSPSETKINWFLKYFFWITLFSNIAFSNISIMSLCRQRLRSQIFPICHSVL